jgi:DDE superfamily endonuclease
VFQVPSSLASLLSLLAPCFTQPSFQTFSMLVVGTVGRVRDCTVTGMLQAAGLVGVWHHSRAHDFFARRRWDPDELGLWLLEFLVTVFVKADAPLRFAVDDTLFGRSGRKVWGAHYLHDGAQPEGSGRRTRWGNCWVVLVLVVELPCLGGRPVGLPILFRLFRPKDERHPDRRSQAQLARELIDMILGRFQARIVELVMDGAYASKAWQGLPDRVTLTTRMRANAAVFALARPARIRRQDPRRIPLPLARLFLDALVVHARRADRNRSRPDRHPPLPRAAVADHQPVSVVVDLASEPLDVLISLGPQRGGDHPPRALPSELIKREPDLLVALPDGEPANI